MNLISDTALAEIFDMPVAKLHVLRKQHGWPFVRLGRSDVRFTEAQVAQILAKHTVNPAPATPAAVSALPGQTKRSAARSRSA